MASQVQLGQGVLQGRQDFLGPLVPLGLENKGSMGCLV